LICIFVASSEKYTCFSNDSGFVLLHSAVLVIYISATGYRQSFKGLNHGLVDVGSFNGFTAPDVNDPPPPSGNRS